MTFFNRQQLARVTRPHVAVLLLLCAFAVSCSGCSLFVMAGKAVFGDPKVSAPFTVATGKDLTEGEDAVVIICSAPHRVLSNFPALQVDIVDRVSRILEAEGVKVVESGDVASWYDDHGEWGDFSELAAEFKANYVINVDIRRFVYRVPESESLMQGKAEGHISVHEVTDSKARKSDYSGPVTVAFDRDFALMFPTTYPVPRETRSEELFVQGFTDRLAIHLSQHMYDYSMSASIH